MTPNGYDEHQAMWPQMIAALAAIDTELGLPADGCNSTAQTLAAIRALKLKQCNHKLGEPLKPLGVAVIDAIADDGCRNAAGGIYATCVQDFAREVQRAFAQQNGLQVLGMNAGAHDYLAADDKKDAERYRHLRDAKTLDQWIWNALEHTEGDEVEAYHRGLDAAIDEAMKAMP